MIEIISVIVISFFGYLLYLSISPRHKTFWSKQLSPEITTNQIIFDIIGGIVLPILCLILDPIVFRNGLRGDFGFLIRVQIFSYTAIAISIIGLILWLTLGKFKQMQGFLAGVLVTGTLASLLIGIVMLPFTLVGLIIAIGVLGFAPFFTAFVFSRNSYRAIHQVSPKTHPFWLAMTCGIVLTLGIPLILQWQISTKITTLAENVIHGENEAIALQSGETLNYFFAYLPNFTHWQTWQVWQNRPILTEDIIEGKFSINRLKHVGWCSYCWLDIARAYLRETNPDKQAHIAKIYYEATGENILDSRILEILDD